MYVCVLLYSIMLIHITFISILFRFICKNNGILFENDIIQVGVKSEYRQSTGTKTLLIFLSLYFHFGICTLT